MAIFENVIEIWALVPHGKNATSFSEVHGTVRPRFSFGQGWQTNRGLRPRSQSRNYPPTSPSLSFTYVNRSNILRAGASDRTVLRSWGMDRAMLEAHLALAKRHVEQGKRFIARQQAIVAAFQTSGRDASDAIRLPRNFTETQTHRVADCERLTRLLAEYPE